MGVPRGKIRPHAVIGGGIEFTIWGDTEKLEDFFSGITAAPGGATVDKMIDVPQQVVRRYPGDPGFTRKAHKRRYTPDTGIKRGTTPGAPFYCELQTLDAGTGEIVYVATQFTHTGPKFALRAYAKSNAAQNFRLRVSSGRLTEIVKPGSPSTLGGSGTDTIGKPLASAAA